MLNIPEELKTIYKQDRVPIVRELAEKDLVLYFPDLDLRIETDRIVDDSFSLEESLCSTEDLTFGACEGAIFKVTVANLVQDLSGYEFIATQIVNGAYEMPLGTYKVESCKKQNDLWFREIVAYDSMKKANVDVSDWYNSLTWPQTVKTMRESLLTYLGIEYEEQLLTNDDVVLKKTISPSGLIGKDILGKLCEINAGFGHITRENKFKVIQLSGIGLYPSETLYPAEDLFPSESGDYITAGYENTEYEEYIVESITAITIRQDDQDSGVTVGTEGNPYVIEGNYLLAGKSSAELQAIADNILLHVKNKFYRPHNTVMIGLPYIEVGDSVTIITDSDAVESFVFRRTLTGIQSLQDTITATGNQKRIQQSGLSTEVKQLKGKTLRIQKEVDQLSIDMTDMKQGLKSKISLTASQLQTQITDNYNDLSSTITQTAYSLQTQITDNYNDVNSQISQMANNISLKVSKGDVSSQLSMEPDHITISSNRLTIDSDQFKLDGGNAWFGGEIKWGEGNSITNDKYGNTVLEATELLQMNAPCIGIGTRHNITVYDTGTVQINGNINLDGSIELDGDIKINGSTPITEDNKSDYTFRPSTHYQDSTTINPKTTTAGNVGLNGLNVASVNWCNETFQPKSPSDFRLKCDFKSLDEIPDELYLELKPWQYKFKVDSYGKGIFFGLFAQEVESAFSRYGLNALDYNLIEITNKRDWTDEGQYVLDGKVHRINYENFHVWHMKMIQKIYRKVFEIE